MLIDHVRYPGRKHDYRALVLRPKVALTSPGILLLHDRWGLTREAEAIAERLAHEGYVVMVPDLYDGQLPKDDGQARHMMHLLGHQEGEEEVKLALHWLRNQAYTKAHRTAIIGFEHYGTLGILAATSPKFPPSAIVVFYAPVQGILDRLGMVYSAVQGHFAARDKYVPSADVDAFQKALQDAGVVHEIYVYENVGHDFMNPRSENYDEGTATQAWQRMLTFLDAHVRTL